MQYKHNTAKSPCASTHSSAIVFRKKLEQKKRRDISVHTGNGINLPTEKENDEYIERNKGDDCENAHSHNKKTRDNRQIKSNTARKIKCKICSRFDRITIVTILIEQSVVFNGCSE